jgi:CRP/FNR family transcriptional regulator
LLNLSQRLTALGYSPSEFIMRMSREELGNYLGLTLETVSRLFSRFAREGVIMVNQRDIKIIDMAALNELVGKPC